MDPNEYHMYDNGDIHRRYDQNLSHSREYGQLPGQPSLPLPHLQQQQRIGGTGGVGSGYRGYDAGNPPGFAPAFPPAIGNLAPPGWDPRTGELPLATRAQQAPQHYPAPPTLTHPGFIPSAAGNRMDVTASPYGLTPHGMGAPPLGVPSSGSLDFNMPGGGGSGRYNLHQPPSASPQPSPITASYTIQPPSSSPLSVDSGLYMPAPSPRQSLHGHLLQQQQQQQILLQQQQAILQQQQLQQPLPGPQPMMSHPYPAGARHGLQQPIPQLPMQHQQPMPQALPHAMGHHHPSLSSSSRDGGSNAQGRAINKMLLDVVRERTIDPARLQLGIDTFVDRMDCVNLATLLFHTGKKRFLLAPAHINRIAERFKFLREELRSREASNALYGMKCLSSEVPEVRALINAVANKIAASSSDFVAQAVGNALYGCQMMTSDYEEVRYLLLVLSSKVSQCTELLEAQNVGNALYGMRGMNSDHREVRAIVAALTPKIAKAKEELNGQALGNSLYGLQSMSSKEPEVRNLLTILATKAARTWEELKAQEVGNALYGLKRMSTDIPEVRMLIHALVPKIASSPELLDAQAIGNSFYGLQNMKSDNPEVLQLLSVLAHKVSMSSPELDGQAMGNSLYGLQGMSSEFMEVRNCVRALTEKIESSALEMNAQELGNALYGLQNMTSHYEEVRKLMFALASKIRTSRHELTSQEIGNALFGLQGMTSEYAEARYLVNELATKLLQSHSVLDPQGVSNSLFGLQKLSSESTEVQGLVNSLSQKIEHCWKVIGSHHIAHTCFGLQSLSSESVEVRTLIKTLIPKFIACREEMSAKQLSHALYGLQHMSSQHEEVLGLIASLSEKIVHCVDTWTLQHLALTFYGLQCMDSQHMDVQHLLNMLNQKVAFVHWSTVPQMTNMGTSSTTTSAVGGQGEILLTSPCPSPLTVMLAGNTGSPSTSTSTVNVATADMNAFANMIYGFQRFSSNHGDVHKLISMVLPVFYNTYSSTPETLTPAVLANVFYGLQGMSCHLECVHKVIDLLLVSTSIFYEKVRSMIANNVTNNSSMSISAAFMDLVALYQCATLSLFVMPDLSNYVELKSKATALMKSIEILLEQYSELYYQPRIVSVAEQNFLNEIRQVLPNDKFVMKCPHLFKGFEIGIFVQAASVAAVAASAAALSLSTSVVGSALEENDGSLEGLTSTDNNNVSPSGSSAIQQTLAIEIVGSSYTFPCKQHFYQLRNLYLEKEKGLTITLISSDACRSPPGYNGLFASNSKYASLLTTLFPSSLEDAHHFLSSVSMKQQQPFVNPPLNANNAILAEYFDDDYSLILNEQQLKQQQQLLGPHQAPLHPYTPVNTFPGMKRPSPSSSIHSKRKIFGLVSGWIGDHPIINSAATLAGNAFSSHGGKSSHKNINNVNSYDKMNLASSSTGSIKSVTSIGSHATVNQFTHSPSSTAVAVGSHHHPSNNTMLNPYVMVEKGMMPAAGVGSNLYVDSPYGVAGGDYTTKSRLQNVSSETTFMDSFSSGGVGGGSSGMSQQGSVSQSPFHSASYGNLTHHGLHAATDDSDVGSVGSNGSGRMFSASGSVASASGGVGNRFYEEQPSIMMGGGGHGNAPFPTTMHHSSGQSLRRLGGGAGHGLSVHALHNTSTSSLNSNFSDASGNNGFGIAAELESLSLGGGAAAVANVGRSPGALYRKSPKSQMRDILGNPTYVGGGSYAGSINGSVSSLEYGNQSQSEDEYDDPILPVDDADANIRELEMKIEEIRREQRLKDFKRSSSNMGGPPGLTANALRGVEGLRSNSESPLVLPHTF